MKSAYELAMERLGGEEVVNEEQKAALAEIDNVHDAKRAQAELKAQDATRRAGGDTTALDEAKANQARALQRIEENREQKKQAARDS
jgi:hypothetical protein